MHQPKTERDWIKISKFPNMLSVRKMLEIHNPMLSKNPEWLYS